MGTQAQCPCWTRPLPRGHCWGRGKSPDGQGATIPTGLSGTKGQMGRLALNLQGAASQEPRTRPALPPRVLPPPPVHATLRPALERQHQVISTQGAPGTSGGVRQGSRRRRTAQDSHPSEADHTVQAGW